MSYVQSTRTKRKHGRLLEHTNHNPNVHDWKPRAKLSSHKTERDKSKIENIISNHNILIWENQNDIGQKYN